MPRKHTRDVEPSLESQRARYISPLRYPGGKARLVDFFERLIERNGLTDGHYVEPYAGGAGLALGLLQGGVVSHIHLNDLDRSVYALWFTIINDSDWLCERIVSCELSIREWSKQRLVQRNKRQVSLRSLAFSTFFLNRTNRSGIIRSGGPIGGLGQEGKW